MKNLITLVKMQLKEKLNLKGLEYEGINAFKVLVSIVSAILKFTVSTAVFAVLLILVNFLGISTSAEIMSMVFAVMLLASLVSCTLGLTKAMYFSRDNAILLTLPCKPIQVYLSKLIIFFAYEMKRNFSFMVPLFFAHYIVSGFPIGAYLWLLVCFVFISLFTTALSSILSIPVMWISSLFRQHRTLQVATLIVAVFAVGVGLFIAISLIPPTLDLRATWPITLTQISSLSKQFADTLGFYYDLTLVFLGELLDGVRYSFDIGATALRLLTLVGITAALLVFGVAFALPLFYKMSSTPFEYLKKSVKPKRNRVVHRSLTSFITELIGSIKDSGRMYTNIGIMISTPLLIFLLNKIFFAMNTDSTGDYLIMMFNVLIILLIVLNSNTSAASIYSRDGRAAYLIKTQPTSPAVLLFSKLMPDAVFCIISLIGTFVILLISSNLGFLNVLFLMLGIMFIYFAHLMYCAELDIMNPQYEIYATVGASDNNPNETKATLSAFIISFLTAGVVVLLLMDYSAAIRIITIAKGVTLNTVYLKLFCVALAAAIYKIYTYFSKIKLYYKEK